MMLEPLGEVGANFSLQLSSRTQFTKINNKKVIAENQCEKNIKIELFFLITIHPCVNDHLVYVYCIDTVYVQNNLPTEFSKMTIFMI